jgi:Calx-beta domain
MTRRFLALLAVVCASAPTLRAAGVVGNGTPSSCTEPALAAAMAGGGSVTFDCGPGAVTIPLTSELVVSASTAIDGGGTITLSGQNATRLFRVPDAPAPGTSFTLQRVSVIGGNCPTLGSAIEPGLGGALWAGARAQVALTDVRGHFNVCTGGAAATGGGFAYVRGASLRLQRFDGFINQARDGATVLAVDSDVTIEDSDFNSSSADRGGIVFATGGRVVFRRSRVLGVSATEAGGAFYGSFAPGDGGLTIEDASFVAPSSAGDGGAVYHHGGPLRITGSSLTGTARRGGAVYLAQGSVLDISNTSFGYAKAVSAAPGDGTGRGGAFFLSGASTGSISHSTFGLNTADAGGGAFGGDGPSAIVLRASLLEKNATGTLGTLQPSCTSTLASGGFNLQDPGEPGDADCAPGVLRELPGLVNFDFHGGTTRVFGIDGGSPAIDLVTNGCPPPATDQRGMSRPQMSNCDAGAFEWVPVIQAGEASIFEGNSGTRPAEFRVFLSGQFDETVTVAYATADQEAVAGVDYIATSGTLTFPPGTTEQTVVVQVLGDAVQEFIEHFALVLSEPTGGRLGTGPARAVIYDDDFPAPITIFPTTGGEGSLGGSCVFGVQLGAQNGAPVSIDYVTADESAHAGSDYQSTSGTLTFPPGVIYRFVTVPLVDDDFEEPEETFRVSLSNPQNGTVGSGPVVCRIEDDDGPGIVADDLEVVEGDGVPHEAFLTVSLTRPAIAWVGVDYATSPGTAQEFADYSTTFGTLTFAPGVVSQTARVVVHGDVLDEPAERFHVRLFQPHGGHLVDADGVVTIADDDGTLIHPVQLSHATAVRSDLAGGSDLYIVTRPPFGSWEAILDEASGDVGRGDGPVLERLAVDLSTVVQTAGPVGAGPARTLSWIDAYLPYAGDEQYLRVTSAGCSRDCGPDDVYRLRTYETTLRSPRFNCVGGQATVLVLQNTATAPVVAIVTGWDGSGSWSFSLPTSTLEPHGLATIPLCTTDEAAGKSGSLTVAHDGGYGQLVGKVVAVDPATGASFDTPLTARPR